jgi:hypothetical protein
MQSSSDFFILILRLFITFIAYSLPDVPFLQAVTQKSKTNKMEGISQEEYEMIKLP